MGHLWPRQAGGPHGGRCGLCRAPDRWDQAGSDAGDGREQPQLDGAGRHGAEECDPAHPRGQRRLVPHHHGRWSTGSGRSSGRRAGLKVSRTWLSAEGEPLDVQSHSLGERVFVQVDITNTGSSRVSNVAVVDALPAGWEIENPRLGAASRPDWARSSSAWNVEHMNIRDDRVEAFGSIGGSRTVTLLYAVRAVTAGTFHAPDVTAEAMYDPSIWARQLGQELTIQGPWAGFFL